MNDPINHPAHYCQGGIECFDVIKAALGIEGAMAFCMGNAIKYLFRHLHKDSPGQDVRKARWYIDSWIRLDEENAQTTPTGCPFEEEPDPDPDASTILRMVEAGVLHADLCAVCPHAPAIPDVLCAVEDKGGCKDAARAWIDRKQAEMWPEDAGQEAADT